MTDQEFFLLTYAQACICPRLGNIHMAYRQRVEDILEAETVGQLFRGLKGLPHHNLTDDVAASVLGCMACFFTDAEGVWAFLLQEVVAGVPGARDLLAIWWQTLLD